MAGDAGKSFRMTPCSQPFKSDWLSSCSSSARMTPLTNIFGVTPESAEILRAAGISAGGQLAREDAVQLHRRLEMIAWQRGRGTRAPALETVEHWILCARTVTPIEEQEAPVPLEAIPEALAMAIPVKPPPPPQSPAWMPPSVRAAQEATGGGGRPLIDHANARPPAAAGGETVWRKVDASKYSTIEAYHEGSAGVQPLQRNKPLAAQLERTAVPPGDEEEEPAPVSRRVQRIKSQGAELSRWVKRGVVHTRPVHTWIGAVVSLLWRTSLLAAAAGLTWVFATAEQPSDYTREILIGLGAMLVLGALQLHFAGRSRCRICSCPVFYSKNCIKNRKAHLIPILGYVASLSLHLVLFRWFRCMYCGTATKLSAGKRDVD